MSALAYAVESWFDVRAEVGPLWRLHYAEIADKRIPLDPDFDRYDQIALLGKLHIVTVRDRGKLVGYLFAIVDTHLHYRHTLFAGFDLYWVDPVHRRGWAGVRLFREAEQTLRARGVRKVVANTKVAKDMSRIFERLGFQEAERIHTKYLGD